MMSLFASGVKLLEMLPAILFKDGILLRYTFVCWLVGLLVGLFRFLSEFVLKPKLKALKMIEF